MPILNLDTHILIHALSGKLREREHDLLTENRWGIAAIVLWELAKLAQLQRIDIDLEDQEVEKAIASLHIWPLDFAIARASARLDFKGDPADELIAATSVVQSVPLLTRDRRIRRSKIVPLA